MNTKNLDVSGFPLSISVMQQALKDGVAPGFVAGVWQKKEPDTIYVSAMGNRRVVPTASPMRTDTVFDLASLTKVFATSALIAWLVDTGRLEWSLSLSEVLPNYPYPEIQLQHLLAHTAGLPAWLPLWKELQEENPHQSIDQLPVALRKAWYRNRLSQLSPELAPGQRALYSDPSFMLLGMAIEEVLSMDLAEASKKFVWTPMDITQAEFRRVARHEVDESVAATEVLDWRGGVIQGQVHDENCWAMGGVAGHAGVFGTVQAVLKFAAELVKGNFLSTKVREQMWSPVKVPSGCSRTLGWDTPSGEVSSAGKLFSRRSVGHLGFTGTSLWIDLDAELAVVLLSNRVHPTRTNEKIRQFRPIFHEAIRKDLG